MSRFKRSDAAQCGITIGLAGTRLRTIGIYLSRCVA
jgi:hypothetical protein